MALSTLGKYSGYSEPIYKKWRHSSQYITVQDGVKLAVNILLPSQSGQLTTEPLPVIWASDRYHQAYPQNNKWPESKLDRVSSRPEMVKQNPINLDETGKTWLDQMP